MGIIAPFAGWLADRFGSARLIAGGGVVYVFGMVATATMHDGPTLVAANVLIGIGLSAATFGPVLGAVMRLTPVDKQPLAVGICSAGGSFGHFFVVPLAVVLQGWFGDWRPTIWVLAALALLMIVLPMGLNDRQAIAVARAGRDGGQTSRQALSEAFGQRSYILLISAYFVCGFHVTFVGGHLPAYISDKQIDLRLFGVYLSPAELGGWALGLVGLFNIVGVILWSTLASAYKRKNLLALLYLLRSLTFLVFILAPLSAASVLIFAGTLGFLWLGTVPLTTSLVRHIFGPVHLTMLNGVVFFSHQVGSFIGGWGAGRLFDLQGNYDMMWVIAVALGLIAALLHWPIVEQRVERPGVVPQAA